MSTPLPHDRPTARNVSERSSGIGATLGHRIGGRPKRDTPDDRLAQRGLLAAIVATLALLALTVTACSGTQHPTNRVAVAYRFQCTPRDARVIVDEVDQGVCQLWEQQYLGLGAGTHRLRIEREGYLPIERELPSTGRRESVRVELHEQPE